MAKVSPTEFVRQVRQETNPGQSSQARQNGLDLYQSRSTTFGNEK